MLSCGQRVAFLTAFEAVNVNSVMADLISVRKMCSVSVSQSKVLRFLVVYLHWKYDV